MGREELAVQREIAQFVGSVKDTSPMMHSKPRFLYHKEWLDMEFWNQRNYIEMFYASEYHEVGTEYDWANSKQIKVDIEFNGWFAYFIVRGIEFSEDNLPLITKFVKENNYQVVIPATEELTEEELSKHIMNGGGTRSMQPYFIIDSFIIFDPDKIKEAITVVDNELNNYSPEGMI